MCYVFVGLCIFKQMLQQVVYCLCIFVDQQCIGFVYVLGDFCEVVQVWVGYCRGFYCSGFQQVVVIDGLQVVVDEGDLGVGVEWYQFVEGIDDEYVCGGVWLLVYVVGCYVLVLFVCQCFYFCEMFGMVWCLQQQQIWMLLVQVLVQVDYCLFFVIMGIGGDLYWVCVWYLCMELFDEVLYVWCGDVEFQVVQCLYLVGFCFQLYEVFGIVL